MPNSTSQCRTCDLPKWYLMSASHKLDMWKPHIQISCRHPDLTKALNHCFRDLTPFSGLVTQCKRGIRAMTQLLRTIWIQSPNRFKSRVARLKQLCLPYAWHACIHTYGDFRDCSNHQVLQAKPKPKLFCLCNRWTAGEKQKDKRWRQATSYTLWG